MHKKVKASYINKKIKFKKLKELFSLWKEDLAKMKKDKTSAENGNTFEESELTRFSIEPPKTLQEFEDRLGDIFVALIKHYFGVAYYVYPTSKLTNSASIENLIKIANQVEKFSDRRKSESIDIPLDCYLFLKKTLESNFRFSKLDQDLLGMVIDRTNLTKPKKRMIAVQCAVQVLWYLEKDAIPTIEAMIAMLKDKKRPFFELLELQKTTNPQTLQRWIRAIFPVPKDQRKKRSKVVSAYSSIVPIPALFTITGIKFPWLRFATISITCVMKACGCSSSEIINSSPIGLLVERLKFYPKLYVRDWVEEAYSTNGSIFDS